MSVETEADRRAVSAQQHVEGAIRNISVIVIDECDGYDEWGIDFKEILNILLDLRRRFRRE